MAPEKAIPLRLTSSYATPAALKPEIFWEKEPLGDPFRRSELFWRLRWPWPSGSSAGKARGVPPKSCLLEHGIQAPGAKSSPGIRSQPRPPTPICCLATLAARAEGKLEGSLPPCAKNFSRCSRAARWAGGAGLGLAENLAVEGKPDEAPRRPARSCRPGIRAALSRRSPPSWRAGP